MPNGQNRGADSTKIFLNWGKKQPHPKSCLARRWQTIRKNLRQKRLVLQTLGHFFTSKGLEKQSRVKILDHKHACRRVPDSRCSFALFCMAPVRGSFFAGFSTPHPSAAQDVMVSHGITFQQSQKQHFSQRYINQYHHPHLLQVRCVSDGSRVQRVRDTSPPQPPQLTIFDVPQMAS